MSAWGDHAGSRTPGETRCQLGGVLKEPEPCLSPHPLQLSALKTSCNIHSTSYTDSYTNVTISAFKYTSLVKGPKPPIKSALQSKKITDDFYDFDIWEHIAKLNMEILKSLQAVFTQLRVPVELAA